MIHSKLHEINAWILEIRLYNEHPKIRLSGSVLYQDRLLPSSGFLALMFENSPEFHQAR